MVDAISQPGCAECGAGGLVLTDYRPYAFLRALYLNLFSNDFLPESDCAQHEGRLSDEIGNPAAQADGILIFLLNPISQVCSQHFYSTPKINVIICCLPIFYSTECHMDI